MKNEFVLVSVKSKSNQNSSKVFVVEKNSIGSFISSNLNSDTLILIDSVETFVSGSQEE